MMPSIPLAQIPPFSATEKRKHTNEVNSFGRFAVFLQRDSFVSGPQSRWFGVVFILIT